MNRACSIFFSGEIISNRVLLTLLGINKYHEVWLAHNRVKQDYTVLKFFSKTSPRFKIIRELVTILQNINAPQIPEIITIFTFNEWFIIEFPYLKSGSLYNYLKTHTPLPLGKSVFIMSEILKALSILHAHGIVHRDIKSSNIWITEKGNLQLGDFGIAKLESAAETAIAVFGTPTMMSPEQSYNSNMVDCRSDFFSLSSLIYELLTGHPRFPNRGLVETSKLLRNATKEEFIADLHPYAPHNFCLLLGSLATPNPAWRPGDAAIILQELANLKLPCTKL